MGSRLYPPTIKNKVPAFYGNQLVVPFDMNVTVGADDLDGFMLQIKNLITNSLLATGIVSTNYDLTKKQVIFELPQDVVDKLVQGQYYHIQIAYLPRGYLGSQQGFGGLIDARNKLSEATNSEELKAYWKQVLVDNPSAAIGYPDEQLYLTQDGDAYDNYWAQTIQHQNQYDLINNLLSSADPDIAKSIPLDLGDVSQETQDLVSFINESGAKYDFIHNTVVSYVAVVDDKTETLYFRYGAQTFQDYMREKDLDQLEAIQFLRDKIEEYETALVKSCAVNNGSRVKEEFDNIVRKGTYNKDIETEYLSRMTDKKEIEKLVAQYLNIYYYVYDLYSSGDPDKIFEFEKSMVLDKLSRMIDSSQVRFEQDADLLPQVGYYSTTGVTKYTGRVDLSIQGLQVYSVGSLYDNFIGIYTNPDRTERVAKYSFYLRDSKNNIVDSVENHVHNSTLDGGDYYNVRSIDKYSPQLSPDSEMVYTIQYKITTINDLEVMTPRYKVQRRININEINANAIDFTGKVDSDEGIITININPKDQALCQGTFLLSRIQYDDNDKPVKTLKLKRLNITNPVTYYDYTVEQDIHYRYTLERINTYGLYSQPIYATNIDTKTTVFIACFEDSFLYDGKRQLKIRFNPQMSSFKHTVLESKTETIGSKYPYIFRNGVVGYKEFPLGGLISFIENKHFLSFSEGNQTRLSTPAKDSSAKEYFDTDCVDDNIRKERIFKLEVLDFLTDGKVKLFRSPTEGVYLVRLLNAQLAPETNVNRMIHNFSCTADEIAEVNYDNLRSFGIIEGDSDIFNTTPTYLSHKITPDDPVDRNLFADLGRPIRAVLFDTIGPYNAQVLIDNTLINVGATRNYELPYGVNITSISLPGLAEGVRPLSGTITIIYDEINTTDFDILVSTNSVQYPCVSYAGMAKDFFNADASMANMPIWQQDITKQSNRKEKIDSIQFLRFFSRPLEKVILRSPEEYQKVMAKGDDSGEDENQLRTYPTYFKNLFKEQTRQGCRYIIPDSSKIEMPYISRLPLYYITSDNSDWYASDDKTVSVFDLGQYFYRGELLDIWSEVAPKHGVDFHDDSLFEIKLTFNEEKILDSKTGRSTIVPVEYTYSVARDNVIEIEHKALENLLSIQIGWGVYMEAGIYQTENTYDIEQKNNSSAMTVERSNYATALKNLNAWRGNNIIQDYTDWYCYQMVLEKKVRQAKTAYYQAVDQAIKER